jgi:hypothetical protein
MSLGLSMDSEDNNPVTIPYPRCFAQSVQVERVVLNALEMRLRGFAIISTRRDDPPTLAFALVFGANGFECAVLYWSVSDQRGEIHLAGDQIRGFKFSFARQRSGVAPDVTEKKFHWA